MYCSSGYHGKHYVASLSGCHKISSKACLKRVNNSKIEERKSSTSNCVTTDGNNEASYSCRIRVPIGIQWQYVNKSLECPSM